MKKLLALVMVVVMASPAFAAVQNVKVSGSINSNYVNRADFDFDGGISGTDYNQSFTYTTSRVAIDADLSDNVSTKIGLVNEMIWGDQTAANQNIDLEYANVTLREMLYSPLTVTIGRQDLNYGNGFLVADGGGASVGGILGAASDLSRTYTYDGVKAVLDYKPLTLDLFYAKTNSNNSDGSSGAQKDDVTLSGVNANYQLGDAMNTVVEGYFFARVDNSGNNVGAAAEDPKADTLYVPGLRASTNPVKGLNVGVEGAVQMGNKRISSTNVKRDEVFAFQGMASYELPVLEQYKPVASGSYTYVSGDQNPTHASGNAHGQASSENYTAWDPLFNDQNIGRVWRSLFGYTNLHVAELAISATPVEDVTAKLSWTGLWLDRAYTEGGVPTTTSITLPDGGTITPAINSNKELGSEIDADLTYQYTEDVKFGLTVGVFKPGNVFTSENDTMATQAIASVGVNF